MVRWIVFGLAVCCSAYWSASAADNAAAPATAAPQASNAAGERRVGRLIRLDAPLDDRTDVRVRRAVEAVLKDAKSRGEWPVFIFELHQGRTKFGQALELARFLSGPSLNGATTVAYLPETITGHNVFVAMACDEIIMAENAEIGAAGEDELVIEPSLKSAYLEIANRRKTIPADLAVGLLDPAAEVLVVETEVSREFVLAERLEKLREERAVQASKVLKPTGQPGRFTGAQGRELGFVSYLAADRLAVAKALGLSRDAIEEDPSLEGKWRPVRIDVKGPVTAHSVSQIQSILQREIESRDVNFICVWIDSPGGSPDDSINLANALASLDPAQRRTVAYIPTEARADAAFIALACDHIVMHPGAILGGPGAYEMTEVEVPLAVTSLEEIVKRKSRPTALAAAMADPKVRVFRYRRQADGLVDYYTESEAAKLGDAAAWQKEIEVTNPGVFRVEGEKAETIGLARNVVRNFDEFKNLYGLEDDPALVEPGWADVLLDAMHTPGMRLLLLLIGGAALYAELQAPGVGLGGLIAAVCFLFFFWSAYLGGTAGWLEVLLFLLGVACLLLELFVLPGFGVFGLGGGLMIIASLVLASQTFWLPRNEYQMAQLRNTLVALAGAGVGTVVAAVVIRRYMPRTPGLQRMLLAPPTAAETSDLAQRESLTRLEYLVGERGVTTTPLLPSGKARFGDQLVDVIADGEVVERGAEVVVVEVRGNRVLVRQRA